MTPAPGQSILVLFSCGAASAIAAAETLRLYGATNPVTIINNPVLEEGFDNRRFLIDVMVWLLHPIIEVRSRKYPNASAREVWARRKFMAGPHGAPCTDELKKRARQEWTDAHPTDWYVLGFTSEERKRHDRFCLTEVSNVLPVLIDANLTKQDCVDRVQAAGLQLPKAYKDGLPNANCLGCVKATSATYWNLVRELDPAVFADRATQSRELGARLVRHKGARIFLDELPADAQGAPLKSMHIECGVFCEEPDPDGP